VAEQGLAVRARSGPPGPSCACDLDLGGCGSTSLALCVIQIATTTCSRCMLFQRWMLGLVGVCLPQSLVLVMMQAAAGTCQTRPFSVLLSP